MTNNSKGRDAVALLGIVLDAMVVTFDVAVVGVLASVAIEPLSFFACKYQMFIHLHVNNILRLVPDELVPNDLVPYFVL